MRSEQPPDPQMLRSPLFLWDQSIGRFLHPVMQERTNVQAYIAILSRCCTLIQGSAKRFEEGGYILLDEQ
jgi:hypothetical protein